MEALIDSIVTKLQNMPVSKIQTALAFVDSLERQADQPSGYCSSIESSAESDEMKQARWEAAVRETAGIWPDFPLVEEIRQGYGEDAPREEW